MAYSTERIYEGRLLINSCGKRDLREGPYDTLWPQGRVDYSIQYIRQGCCQVALDGRMETAREGELILFFPRVYQHYIFPAGVDTVLMFGHFSGTACELLEPLRSEHPVILRISDRHEFERSFEKLLQHHYHGDPASRQLSYSYLELMLALILKSRDPRKESGNAAFHEGLEKVLSHMLVCCDQPIDLDAYARMCYVSKNRFIHLFKAHTGLPPYRYQLKIRLERARDMLENTTISVNECARAVGFTDVSYFCRIFRKWMGHPPGYYQM